MPAQFITFRPVVLLFIDKHDIQPCPHISKRKPFNREIIYKETSLIGKDNEHQKTDCWKKE